MSRAFSPKMARSSFSSAVSSVSPLGVTLPTRMSPGPTQVPGNHDAFFVEVRQIAFTNIGDVTGDFFWPQLGFASFDLMLLDVRGSETVAFYQILAQDDGVLVVAAAPTHEANEDVLPQS